MPDHVTAGAELVLHCNRRSDMGNKLLNRFISAITSLALVLSIYNCFSDSITNTYAVTLTTLEKTAAVSAEGSENPLTSRMTGRYHMTERAGYSLRSGMRRRSTQGTMKAV